MWERRVGEEPGAADQGAAMAVPLTSELDYICANGQFSGHGRLLQANLLTEQYLWSEGACCHLVFLED